MKKFIVIFLSFLMFFSFSQGSLEKNVVKAANYLPEDFAGYWINDNEATGGVTKVFIKIAGEDFQVQVFGKKDITDLDWGISTTKIADGEDGELELDHWGFSFATAEVTIKLIDKNHAEIDVKEHFTDNSGRQDFEIKEGFSKANMGDFDKVLLSLFKDVKKLSCPGALSIITLTKPAIPLVISNNDSSPSNQIAIAGSKYGKGFVLGFCHCDFFKDINFDNFDNKIFISNILSNTSNKKVLVSVSHGEFLNQSNTNKFSDYVKGLGFEIQFLNNSISIDSLKGVGILVLISGVTNEISEEEIFAIKDFVNKGGIFLLAGLGWLWAQNYPDKALEDLPANKIGKEFGIKWEKDYIQKNEEAFTILYPEALFAIKRDQLEKGTFIGISRGLNGGWIESLIIDPINTNTIYAGTERGVYKSTDGGLNWIEINKGLPKTLVSFIGLDPIDNQIIYINMRAEGLFKSNNGGLNWIKLETGSIIIYNIIIDPQNTQTIYILGEENGKVGITKSINGGLSWEKPKNNGLQTVDAVYSFAIDPINTQIIFIGTSANEIWKSTDGGENWFDTSDGLPKAKIEIWDRLYMKSLVINPINTQVIYTGTNYRSGGHGIFKSTNGGESWTNINNGLGSVIFSIDSLVIDPLNSQVIYAGTSTSSLDEKDPGGIYKSIDGGINWIQKNNGLEDTYANCLAINPKNTQIIYAGTYAGVFKSTNGGFNWKDMSNGLDIIDANFFVRDPKNNKTVYAGTYAGVFKSTDGGINWVDIKEGLIGSHVTTLCVDPINSQTIYAGTKDGLFKSTNGGKNWFKVINNTNNSNSVTVAIDPKNTQVVYAERGGIETNIFKSIDGGINWKTINSPFAVKNIIICSQNTQIIYIVAFDGIYKSINGGTNWEKIVKGLTGTEFSTLVLDPENMQIIYAGTNEGLFKSTNGGLNWVMIMSSRSINSLVIDPTNTQIIYAGRGDGLFKSINGGLSWTKLSSERVSSISLDPENTQTIYVGLNGVSKYVPYYNIITVVGFGGTIFSSGEIPVNSGDSRTFNIIPNPGYYIQEVKVDGVAVGAVLIYTFNNVITDHTIEVQFGINTFTIIVSAGEGGSISPSGTIKANSGNLETFTITPNSGYKIKEITVDGVSIGAVISYTFAKVTADHKIEATFEKSEIALVLKIGNSGFTINGDSSTLDSPPVIKNGRTLVPIRAILEALGGTVGWNEVERKATVALRSTSLELWIGKSAATVNGTPTPIDSTNTKVVPEIINGRTMLPLRFVAEQFGATVTWEASTQTITITYQP